MYLKTYKRVLEGIFIIRKLVKLQKPVSTEGINSNAYKLYDKNNLELRETFHTLVYSFTYCKESVNNSEFTSSCPYDQNIIRHIEPLLYHYADRTLQNYVCKVDACFRIRMESQTNASFAIGTM